MKPFFQLIIGAFVFGSIMGSFILGFLTPFLIFFYLLHINGI